MVASLLASTLTAGGGPARAQAREEPAANTKELDKDLASIAWGANRFALELYQKAAAGAKAEESLCLSPASVHMALSMATLGAQGATEEEMRRTLHLAVRGDNLLAALRERQRRLETPPPGKLGRHGRPAQEILVASAVFAREGFPLRDDYVGAMGKALGARVDVLDFGRPAEAAEAINGWIARSTRQRLHEILAPETIRPESSLLLVNAVYLTGLWEDAFQKGGTRKLPFHLANGAVVEAWLMQDERKLGYLEEDGLQVLDLPYLGGELSMLVLLPLVAKGLGKVEAQLGMEQLARWKRGLPKRTVGLGLPRFDIETKLDILPRLRELGLKRALDGAAADFGRLASEAVFISSVVHGARVTVDEEGTEASAATIADLSFGGGFDDDVPVRFVADHPFLYLIRHAPTDTILFIGRVMDPR